MELKKKKGIAKRTMNVGPNLLRISENDSVLGRIYQIVFLIQHLECTNIRRLCKKKKKLTNIPIFCFLDTDLSHSYEIVMKRRIDTKDEKEVE